MIQSRVYVPSDKEDEAVENLKNIIARFEQRRESVREVRNFIKNRSRFLKFYFSVKFKNSS